MNRARTKARVHAERRGRLAEWAAILFLMAKGYRILGHRLRTPYGEVDVAAWRGGVLVVVEVKARRRVDDGLYAVTPRQQQRIAAAAATLAARWRLGLAPIRFDVIVMDGLWPRAHRRGAWAAENGPGR